MTDRVSAFIVVLKQDIREDDAEAIAQAIGQLRGVLTVQPHMADASTGIAEARVRHELSQKLWGVLYPKSANPLE